MGPYFWAKPCLDAYSLLNVSIILPDWKFIRHFLPFLVMHRRIVATWLVLLSSKCNSGKKHWNYLVKQGNALTIVLQIMLAFSNLLIKHFTT